MNSQQYEQQKEVYRQLLVGKTISEAKEILANDSRPMSLDIWHSNRPIRGEVPRNQIIVICDSIHVDLYDVNGHVEKIATSDGTIIDFFGFAW
jgi:hypothetical protein